MVVRKEERGSSETSPGHHTKAYMLIQDCAFARGTWRGSIEHNGDATAILQSFLQTSCFSANEQNHKAGEASRGLADNAQRMARDRLRPDARHPLDLVSGHDRTAGHSGMRRTCSIAKI